MNTRRQFMQAGALFLVPAYLPGGIAANDRIRVGIAGVKGRGFALMRSLLEIGTDNHAEVAAICDVDSAVLSQRKAACEKRNGGKPVTAVADMRRMMEDKSIDAIIHATPTNWHALGAIWTMQAGKDAYIEKPLALTLWEGRKIVEAARKYGRIVQHGTQCRSSPEILEAMSLLREGAIGEVYLARGLGHKYRPGIGKLKPETPPASLNYELWRGPAPMKPYSANQVHYNWHWFWDTGNGDLGNLAVHGLDVARMALRLDGLPDRVQSMGGNFVFNDAKETPNFQTSVFRYTKRNVMLEYSIRNAYSNSEGGMGESIPFTLGDKRDSHAVIIYGSEGYMLLPDYTSYYIHLGRDRKLSKKRIGAGDRDPVGFHLKNFLAAMRSRKSADLAAEAEEGRKSASLCHLANIAYRVGRTLKVDPATEEISGDAEASALATRVYRHGYEVPQSV
jgi:predicted dehydrogenase